MNFLKRRIRNTILLGVAIVIAYTTFDILDLSLHIQQYYSGWLMVFIVLFMLSFYVKKKLTVLPLGRTASWAQWHYYSGFFMFALFLKHIEFSIPDGNLEFVMSIFLLLVVVVGSFGCVINRVLARRLAYLPEEVIFERIAGFREKLRLKVEERLLDTVKESKSNTLADYYSAHLADYFTGSRHLLAHLFGSRFPYLKINSHLQQQIRYLNPVESAFVIELEDYIKQKNTLDTHLAVQGLLKYWSLLHVPFAVVLSLLILIHIVLVYAFRGAA